MEETREQSGSAFVELLHVKTVNCSDQAFALIHALAVEKGITYSDALDELLLNRPQEPQADPDGLAKT
jgi:hypothetical protein